MTSDDYSTRTQTSIVIVDLDGERTLGPAESASLLRDSLALTQKRLRTSLRVALETPHMWWHVEATEVASLPEKVNRERDLISTLRQSRDDFLPPFQAVFEESFQHRAQGHMRVAQRRANSGYELTLVDPGDLSGQVALKQVIRAMHDASKDELYALNFRVRLLLRETPDGKPFDNPWSPDYICDAFGSVCRGLWHDSSVWRPIMAQLIRFMTPHLEKFYRELNGYLQDRDVLPTLRVRVRARDGEMRPISPAVRRCTRRSTNS